MYNVLIIREADPDKEFGGLWYNENSGAIWVWAKKPVLVGFSKDGKLLGVDVFDAEFKYTPRRNEQQYSVTYEYGKVPLLMIAQVLGDDGAEVEISLGGLYGMVDITNENSIVSPIGNVDLGADLTLACEPTKGFVKIKLTVISYE